MTLSEAVKKIDIRYRMTFYSTLVSGLLAQGMGLFNKFSWHDDIYLFGVGGTTVLGRWMLDFSAKIVGRLFEQGQFSLPVFNGAVTLVFIGLSACLIVDILNIRSQGMCVFTGSILAVFPSVTATFAYVFTLPYYAFGYFLGMLGAWLLCMPKGWYWRLAGIVCIGCSLGIYQAYLPSVICVLLIYLIGCATCGDDVPALTLIKRTFLMVLCGGG